MQLLEGNCSAVLCWPLTLINTNQPQVYICPIPPETPSHFPPPSHSSRLSQNTVLSSLFYRENSHLLSILHIVMYMFPYYSFTPLLCLKIAIFSLCLFMSLPLCLCLSFPFLKRILIILD